MVSKFNLVQLQVIPYLVEDYGVLYNIIFSHTLHKIMSKTKNSVCLYICVHDKIMAIISFHHEKSYPQSFFNPFCNTN